VHVETGFSRATKLAIRTRAGSGDPAEAYCEACPRWLGRYLGQVQHRGARKSGGSRLRNNIANGVLLCGTSETLCHGLCEDRDRDMEGAGFWFREGLKPLSLEIPIMLHDRSGGGVKVWLDDFGNYLDAQGCILAFGALAGAP
jgi:hypothetical protein